MRGGGVRAAVRVPLRGAPVLVRRFVVVVRRGSAGQPPSASAVAALREVADERTAKGV
ncbi:MULTISPECIES: hypothetical protein [Streptomyces]|uniref:hypothetical protein n=1 Tax=Streptomyces TaxID=1883 RepID=UPI002F2668EE